MRATYPINLLLLDLVTLRILGKILYIDCS